VLLLCYCSCVRERAHQRFASAFFDARRAHLYFHRVIVTQPVHLSQPCTSGIVVIGGKLRENGLVTGEVGILAGKNGRMRLRGLLRRNLEDINQVACA
jgi:hypothetical protein